MKDELEQLLKSLHLRRVAELFEEESKRAEKQKPTYEESVSYTHLTLPTIYSV